LGNQLPLSIVMDGDRVGYVLGEHWLGVATGLTDVVFVAVGTGIGAGILSGGRVIRGVGGAAGAVGWMALSPQFREDYEATGCWEAESAGPAVARGATRDSAQSVVTAARSGDEACLRVIEKAGTYLGMGVANLVSTFNPQMVVLGGGLMQAGDLFLDPVRRAVLQWANPRAARHARIELSALGDRAGLLGAARLAFDAR
jgi:glucokinase